MQRRGVGVLGKTLFFFACVNAVIDRCLCFSLVVAGISSSHYPQPCTGEVVQPTDVNTVIKDWTYSRPVYGRAAAEKQVKSFSL